MPTAESPISLSGSPASPPAAPPSTALFPGVVLQDTPQNLGAVESNARGEASISGTRRRRPPAKKSVRRRKVESRWKIRRRPDGSQYVEEVNPAGRSRPGRSRRPTRASEKSADAALRRLTGPPDIPQASDEELIFRHSGWWNRREVMKDAMARAGCSAQQMNAFCNCGANAWLEEYADDEGGWRVRCFHCKSRWCLPCARARALMVADNLRSKLDRGPYVHIVLTLKHREAPLTDQIDRLYRCFKSLRNCKAWKTRVWGGAAFAQIKIGRDGLWHPHLHISAHCAWMAKSTLSAEWLRITGDSDNVDITRIHDVDRLVKEVTRYVSRPVDDDSITDPANMVELIVAMRGRRLCFTFGRWRKFRLTAIPIEAKRPIKQQIRLTDAIAKATRGDVHWQHVLDILRKRSHPSTAPPEDEHYL